MAIDGADGLRALVGKEVGTTPWQVMSLQDIRRFADATGDQQWLHVDLERCRRESPYGAPIAHGYFTVSRIAALYMTLVQVDGCKGVVNYGLDKVRFPTPLRAEASYRLKLELTEVRDVQGAPNAVEGLWKATIEVQNETKPACVAGVIYRYLF